MHDFENETYRVWRPDLHRIVRQAIAQKSAVIMESHMPLDECNSADVRLTGRFLKMVGHQAQYIVDNYDLDIARNFPVAPECEYSLDVDMPLSDGNMARMAYAGKAFVLDTELGRNNLPEGLLLRMTRPSRVRHLRRHERLNCDDRFIMMPGLMLIDQPPANRRHLLNLLGHYYHQRARPKPALVDISAGGVCLRTEDQRCQRFMGAEEYYLFFFFSGGLNDSRCPHVFIGKKVGILRGNDSRHTGLRIRFLKEMIWSDPGEELKWINVEADGSKTIRKLVEAWNRQNQLSDQNE